MDFTVLRKIAEGVCAEVYLVQLKQRRVELPTGSDGIAVLKLAKPGYEDPAIVEAVELRRIASCGTHPHIVSVLGYYEGNGIPRGLLLEYCSGGSLGDYLRGGFKRQHATAPPDTDADADDDDGRQGDVCGHGAPRNRVQASIPTPVARRLFAQLVDALLFLEAMQLWHRDLKPDNVLLTSTNIAEAAVKLSDFGFARRTPHSELRVGRRGSAGSPAFMSPERLRQFVIAMQGRLSVDTDDNVESSMSYCRSKAEVWAAGLILYEMVCGRHLLGPVRSMDDLMNAQFNAQKMLQCDNGLSRPSAELLLDLLLSVLEPDPSKRLGLREVRDHPWLHIETGATASVATPPDPMIDLHYGNASAASCASSVKKGNTSCPSNASVESTAGFAVSSEKARLCLFLSDAKGGETRSCSEQVTHSSYVAVSETSRSSFLSIRAVGFAPTDTTTISFSTPRLRGADADADAPAPAHILTATAPPPEDDEGMVAVVQEEWGKTRDDQAAVQSILKLPSFPAQCVVC